MSAAYIYHILFTNFYYYMPFYKIIIYSIITMNKSNKIFDYEVGKKLGEGSFGEVLLATKGGEKYAIKKISKKQVIKVLMVEYLGQ